MKAKKKIYYKVIREKSRKSAIITDPEVVMTYPVDKWIRPILKGSRIMVFADKIFADSWLYDMSEFYLENVSLMVVSCEAMNPRRISIIGSTFKGSNLSDKFTEFWKHIAYCKRRKMDGFQTRCYLSINKKINIKSSAPASYECSAVKCLD